MVDSICNIIRTCSECGVKEFKNGDLLVRFDNIPDMEEDVVTKSVPTGIDVIVNEEDEQAEIDKADLVDAVTMSEEMLEHLKITDPYEWERLTIEDEANG